MLWVIRIKVSILPQYFMIHKLKMEVLYLSISIGCYFIHLIHYISNTHLIYYVSNTLILTALLSADSKTMNINSNQ